MRICVYRQERSNRYDRIVGHFLVPVRSMRRLYKKPQYYNVIDSNGELQGKILARFYIKPKDENKKDSQEVKNEFSRLKMSQEKQLVRINMKLALVGLRGLENLTSKSLIQVHLMG